MAATPSRLLLKIEQALQAAEAGGERLNALVLRAQRALVLVRLGDLNEARDELTALHQQAFASPHPELSAWLHLAEGLTGMLQNLGNQASEHFHKALALARLGRARSAEAQAHRYLTNLAYYRHDLPALLVHAQAALALPADTDPAAMAGVHLWVGLAHLYAGDVEASRPWQVACRVIATQAGDDACVASLVYNTAELRVAQVRQAELGGGGSGSLPALLACVNSADNFERAVGVASLQVLNPLLRAKVLVAEGRFAEAVALYDVHLQPAVDQGLARLASSGHAELAWCHANLGQTEFARQHADAAAAALNANVDHDDRAVTHGRLAQAWGELGDADRSQHHRAQAQVAWGAFNALQADWRDQLRASGLQAQPAG
ncbi:MAG: hypothetical protein O9335_08830 [Inhella sp.]|jgi:tetratricopeptide (TPR) repeat protein|uniref:hypothetical protein n=1 Tax=Inhella sp. TaxID=1921806 RepID=UPI0022CB5F22|nr:hypothetical protein [Inhella sp.]MCZ8235249.1 hypothetical protein [Inhella sp.]